MSRPGNNPKRRIVPDCHVEDTTRLQLEKMMRYVGSGHHKRHPADYGLQRTNPRPTKSLCDLARVIPLEEAKSLMLAGIRRGLISEIRNDGFPKYIWSVSEHGEVFEAKTDTHGTGEYHGYPLEEEDAMHKYITSVWEERCKNAGQ